MATKSLFSNFAAVAILAGTLSGASGVSIDFQGGGGSSPLQMSFAQPVTFNASGSSVINYFLIKNVGNLLGPGNSDTASGLTYTINGGAPIVIDSVFQPSFSQLEFTPNDIFLSNNIVHPISSLDVVVLSAGTLLTSNNVSGTGIDGDYQIFLIDNFGNRISDDGTTPTAVPDNANTLVLLGLGFLAIVFVSRCRLAIR